MEKETKDHKITPQPIEGIKEINKDKSKKLVNLFLSEDIGTIKNYIIYDVIVPSLRDMIVNVLHKSIDMTLGGTYSYKNNGKVNYSSYSGKGSVVRYGASYANSSVATPINYSTRSLYSVRDYAIPTMERAKKVLKDLDCVMDAYHQVTVADYYDAIGVTGNGFTDNDFGWRDLTGTYIAPVSEGYLIIFPRCVQLKD